MIGCHVVEELLASARLDRPGYGLSNAAAAELILSHLDDLTPELSDGAVVVVSEERIRIRWLPLLHDT
jgi:hypothetical protein